VVYAVTNSQYYNSKKNYMNTTTYGDKKGGGKQSLNAKSDWNDATYDTPAMKCQGILPEPWTDQEKRLKRMEVGDLHLQDLQLQDYFANGKKIKSVKYSKHDAKQHTQRLWRSVGGEQGGEASEETTPAGETDVGEKSETLLWAGVGSAGAPAKQGYCIPIPSAPPLVQPKKPEVSFLTKPKPEVITAPRIEHYWADEDKRSYHICSSEYRVNRENLSRKQLNSQGNAEIYPKEKDLLEPVEPNPNLRHGDNVIVQGLHDTTYNGKEGTLTSFYDGNLQEGWTEMEHKATDRTYYYNAATKASTWHRPNRGDNLRWGVSVAGKTIAVKPENIQKVKRRRCLKKRLQNDSVQNP